MAQQHILVDPLNIPEVIPSTSGLYQVGDDASTSAATLQQSGQNRDSADIRMTFNMRRTNFRQDERDALVQLIAEYQDMTKGGDSTSRGGVSSGRRGRPEGLKAKAWDEIASRFNSNPNFSKRDPHQLRKCWMNMKTRSQFTPSQRRLLGLNNPATSAKSRLGKRKSRLAVNRLRTPTPTSGFYGAARYHAFIRKNSLSRVNRSSFLASQAKPDRSRPPSAGPLKLAKKSKERTQVYDLTQDSDNSYQTQGVSTAEELRPTPAVQFLMDTLQDLNPEDMNSTSVAMPFTPPEARRVTPPAVGLRQLTSPELRRLTPPEVRLSTAEISQVGNNRILTISQPNDLNVVHRTFGAPELILPHGVESIPHGQGQMLNLQQQHHRQQNEQHHHQQHHRHRQQNQQQQQQRIIRNVNRTRPANAQSNGLSQIDSGSYAQLSPSRVSPASNANVRAGEFMQGRSVQTHTDNVQTTYTIVDEDISSHGQALREFPSAVDSSGNSLIPTYQDLQHRTAVNEHVVGKGGVFSIGSMSSQHSSLAGDGPLITNVTSIKSESDPALAIRTPTESESVQETPEVQIVIKEEDMDEVEFRPESSEEASQQEIDRRSNHSSKSPRGNNFSTQSICRTGDRLIISPSVSNKRSELSDNEGKMSSSRQETLPTEGYVSGSSEMRGTAVRDGCQSGARKTPEITEGTRQDDVEIVEDTEKTVAMIIDNDSENDDGFIEMDKTGASNGTSNRASNRASNKMPEAVSSQSTEYKDKNNVQNNVGMLLSDDAHAGKHRHGRQHRMHAQIHVRTDSSGVRAIPNDTHAQERRHAPTATQRGVTLSGDERVHHQTHTRTGAQQDSTPYNYEHVRPVGTLCDRRKEEERKARMDILLFEVQKAEEEAAMARCRRELLEVEVEVETARQQLELTRRKQEAEIELLREKVRQERTRANRMMVGSRRSKTRARTNKLITECEQERMIVTDKQVSDSSESKVESRAGEPHKENT